MLFRAKLRIPEVTLAMLAVGGCDDGDAPPAPDPSDGDQGRDGGDADGGGGRASPGTGVATSTSGRGDSNIPDAGTDAPGPAPAPDGRDAATAGPGDDPGTDDCDLFVLPVDLVQSIRAMCAVYVPCAARDGFEQFTQEECEDYFCRVYTGNEELDLDDAECVAALTRTLGCYTRDVEQAECDIDESLFPCEGEYGDFYEACYGDR